MAEYETALAKVKAAYQAWHDSKGKSADTWVELFADDVDFRSLAAGQPDVPWTRARTTCTEVRCYMEELTAEFTMEHCTVDRFICQDDCIIMLGSTAWRHNKTGKVCATPKVDVLRVKNGKAVSFLEFYDTAGAIAAATP